MMRVVGVSLALVVAVVGAYKPIIMMHGLAFDSFHGTHHV
jgi:hypothetical protein